jgi:hypothetical protein
MCVNLSHLFGDKQRRPGKDYHRDIDHLVEKRRAVPFSNYFDTQPRALLDSGLQAVMDARFVFQIPVQH